MRARARDSRGQGGDDLLDQRIDRLADVQHQRVFLVAGSSNGFEGMRVGGNGFWIGRQGRGYAGRGTRAPVFHNGETAIGSFWK